MTSTPMTQERFEALAQAYGGDLRRWPAHEQAAAGLRMDQAPAACRAVLDQAGDLDGLLDAWRVQPVGQTVSDAILAGAPSSHRRRASPLGWLFPAGLGAGLLAACAAGVITGVQLSSLTQAPSEVDAMASALNGYDGGLADTDSVEAVG